MFLLIWIIHIILMCSIRILKSLGLVVFSFTEFPERIVLAEKDRYDFFIKRIN